MGSGRHQISGSPAGLYRIDTSTAEIAPSLLPGLPSWVAECGSLRRSRFVSLGDPARSGCRGCTPPQRLECEANSERLIGVNAVGPLWVAKHFADLLRHDAGCARERLGPCGKHRRQPDRQLVRLSGLEGRSEHVHVQSGPRARPPGASSGGTASRSRDGDRQLGVHGRRRPRPPDPAPVRVTATSQGAAHPGTTTGRASREGSRLPDSCRSASAESHTAACSS